jgi:hypothetical protein
MKKFLIQTLTVNDDDLNCKDLSKEIETIDLGTLGFVSSDLDKFQSIIYSGSRGMKVLKHPIIPPGTIVKRGHKK